MLLGGGLRSPSAFLVCIVVVVFRVFIPVCYLSSLFIFVIKTYKVSSCVSLAPAI